MITPFEVLLCWLDSAAAASPPPLSPAPPTGADGILFRAGAVAFSPTMARSFERADIGSIGSGDFEREKKPLSPLPAVEGNAVPVDTAVGEVRGGTMMSWWKEAVGKVLRR